MRQLWLSQARGSAQTLRDTADGGLVPQLLPSGLEIYARTPDFVRETLPPELTRGHRLADGVWGLVQVIEGSIVYSLEEGDAPALLLQEGEAAVIEPDRPHHFSIPEYGRFFIELHIPQERLKALIRSGTC